jgi:fatty acid desaturase
MFELCFIKILFHIKKLKIMKQNMGNTDRLIRTFVAIALIALAWMGYITGIWATVAYIGAAVFLLTSLVSFCPLYTLLGISTCPVKKA